MPQNIMIEGSLGPAEPAFLIEHDPASAEWTTVDRATRAAESHPIGGPVRLEALEIPVTDPGAVGLRVFRTIGVGPFRPSLVGRGARDAPIGAQTVRYRPATAAAEDGPTIHLVVDGDAIERRRVQAIDCWFAIRGA